MKLPDFYTHTILNELRSKMGAELTFSNYDSTQKWERIKIQLEQEGIDVSIDEITVTANKTFEYKGQKVLVYIRDQYKKYFGTYRFHVAQCETFKRMVEQKRKSRYVVTNRKDGKFIVNVLESGLLVDKKTEAEILICKNCLNAIGQNCEPNQFVISDFFTNNSNSISNMPKYSDLTSPINAYNPDWDKTALKVKERDNWTCQECFKVLSKSNRQKFLHAHHIDADKSNDHFTNLISLCICCHSMKPGHSCLQQLPEFNEFKSLF